jgi:hypothetical protein
MSQNTTRFAVRVPDGERILFSIVEKTNGELILPISGAEKMGTDWTTGPNVREQRYSIHPSPKSADFTTLKLTIVLEGHPSTTIVALTNAVKKKSGFSIILVRRCQNLVHATQRPIRHKPRDKLVTLPEFDPMKFTLFHGLFVGHPKSKFDATEPNVIIAPLFFKNFQIIVMASLFRMPSHRTTESVHALTARPESAKHAQQEALLRFLMTGRPPEICIRQYNNSVNWLAKRFMERILPETLNPETAAAIQNRISSLGDVTLTQQELGITGKTILMLRDGKPR